MTPLAPPGAAAPAPAAHAPAVERDAPPCVVPPGVAAVAAAAAAAAAAPGPAPLLNMEEYAKQSWRGFRVRVALDLLEHYADAGDVQTCVTVSRVLGSEVESKVGKRRLQRWLVAYIDMLHRLQLWAPASTVMARASDEGIRRLNQMQTGLQPVCATCGKDASVTAVPQVLPDVAYSQFEDAPPVVFAVDGGRAVAVVNTATVPPAAVAALSVPVIDVASVGALQPSAPAHCTGCAADFAVCAVCLQHVRGVYAWCQGCGHGGHLEHMLEWFAQHSSLCPTGCMHVCNLRTSLGGSTGVADGGGGGAAGAPLSARDAAVPASAAALAAAAW